MRSEISRNCQIGSCRAEPLDEGAASEATWEEGTKGTRAASTEKQARSLFRSRGARGRGRADRDGSTAITSRWFVRTEKSDFKVDDASGLGGQKSGTVWARLDRAGDGNGKRGAFFWQAGRTSQACTRR